MNNDGCLWGGLSSELLTHDTDTGAVQGGLATRHPPAPYPTAPSAHPVQSDVVSSAVATSRADRRQTSVVIVGLGYVGLPTAIAFAHRGCRVVGYDVSEDRLAAIRDGAVDLVTRDREDLARHLESESLALTTDATVMRSADAVIVCVPTPVDSYLVPDLSAISTACETVTRHAVPGQLVALTSTTYVGCTRNLVVEPLTARGFTPGHDIFVAFSPERLDPGNSSRSLGMTPRVVGGVTEECQRRAADIFGRITSHVHTLSSPESAEMTKLLENSFRAVNIALINEFADACRTLRLDVVPIIDAAATKPYGYMPFQPGPGVGGHCIPCDPHYLLWQLRSRRAPLPLIETAMTAIATRPRRVFTRILELLGEVGRRSSGARVLLVGVTYKPGVCDLRSSPAVEIMSELLDADATVAYFDPMVTSLTLAGQEMTSVTSVRPQDWDVVVLHTLHPGVDYSWVTRFPIVLDTTYRATHVPQRFFV